MTVKELIEELQKEDPDRIIILQKDGESNGYSPMYGFFNGIYVPETTYSGECYMENLTESDKRAGFSEEDLAPEDVEQIKALFFQPIN